MRGARLEPYETARPSEPSACERPDAAPRDYSAGGVEGTLNARLR